MPPSLTPLLDLACRIQQVPAPTFEERTRALLVSDLFLAERLLDVALDGTGNVYARLPGRNSSAPPLVVSAHLDTVFPLSADLGLVRGPDRIHGPGLGDNALGVAALFGLVWALRATGDSLPGDLWLVANVCEEGLGDLRGMRAVCERFGPRPLAYLVLEGMALGHIYHRGLGVLRYRITARTAGGHSWKDYGQPSAIHELAALITRLTALDLPRDPRTTLNVGRIEGGTSVNTLAAEAFLELDLRSEGAAALAGLAAQVETQVEQATRPGVTFTCEVIGRRPVGGLPVEHPLVALAVDCLRAQGIQAELTIGSTDANLPLSLGYPAVCLGLTTGQGAHTAQEYIDIAPLEKGMAQLLCLARGAWDALR